MDLVSLLAIALLNISLLLLFPFAPFRFAHLILMLLLYLHVRRSPRAMLVEMWGYATAAIAVSIAVSGPSLIWIAERLVELPATMNPLIYWLRQVLILVASLAPMVWFARRASRTSVHHGFVLVALSTALGGSLFPTFVIQAEILAPFVEHASSAAEVPWAILNLCHACLAVVVLSQFDSASPRMRIYFIAGLMSLAALSEVAETATSLGRVGAALASVDVGAAIIVKAIWFVTYFGIAFALVYALRFRHPNESALPAKGIAEDRL